MEYIKERNENVKVSEVINLDDEDEGNQFLHAFENFFDSNEVAEAKTPEVEAAELVQTELHSYWKGAHSQVIPIYEKK